MDYRDERDALRGRVENLEQDLAGAREELSRAQEGDKQKRIEDLERKMADARRVLDELDGELVKLRGRPERRGPGLFLAVGAGFALLGIVGAYLLVSVRPAPRVAPVLPAPALPAEDAPRPVATVAPAREDAPPAREVTRASARWAAKVSRATGLALAHGSSCVIEARLEGAGDKIGVPGLTVTCGDRALYDSADPLNGMSSSGSGVRERAGEERGSQRYVLAYDDQGTRTGKRSQVSIDTSKRLAAVWSDSVPAYRVELDVPLESEAVKGRALLAATDWTLRRGAVVKAVSGQSPVRVGARCDLRVSPLARGGQCQTRLRCGASVVYGAGESGYAECAVEGNAVVRVTDPDTTPNGGDPKIDVDVAAGTVTVADEIGAVKWSADLTLDAP